MRLALFKMSEASHTLRKERVNLDQMFRKRTPIVMAVISSLASCDAGADCGEASGQRILD